MKKVEGAVLVQPEEQKVPGDLIVVFWYITRVLY